MNVRYKRAAIGILLCLMTCILLSGQAAAEELTGELPEELLQAVPDGVEVSEEGDMGLASGVASLWEKSREEMKDYLLAGVKSVAALMCGVVVLGAVESMVHHRQRRSVDHGGICRGSGGSYRPGAGDGGGDFPVQQGSAAGDGHGHCRFRRHHRCIRPSGGHRVLL